MSQPPENTFDTSALTAAVEAAVRNALDTNDEFRAVVDTTIRQALDTPAVRQAIDNTASQISAALRDMPGSENVVRRIQQAVEWPVNRAIAEAVGFDTLAQGTHPEVLRVNHAMQQVVNGPLQAAVRGTIRRATRPD